MKYGSISYYNQALQQFLPYGQEQVDKAFITSMRNALKADNMVHAKNLMSVYDELVKFEDD